MRVALSADMEAISGITDVRQVVGSCPEYWETGRRAMTDDVAAAVQGLLDGGAEEVLVLDNHGAGAPWNIERERLPDGAVPCEHHVFDLPALGIDAMFQVGYHPPAGVAGFVPHTYVPWLRLSVDGVPIGESHGRAWAVDVPLLGMTGHAAHRASLGALSDTPYLVVQEGWDPHIAVPCFPAAQESAQAIREFARRCAQQRVGAAQARSPRDALLSATVEGVTDEQAEGMARAGWRRTTGEGFEVGLRTWRDARDPIATAMSTAMARVGPVWSKLDLTSRGAFSDQDPATLDELTRLFLEGTAQMAG